MGEGICFVYILLPGKTEGMYTEMLREVLNSCRGLGLNPTPQTIVMDFEKAAINAARNVLGVNDITGCYFHFCGSVWKRIQKLGLSNLYNNAQVKLFVGMCIALAFLPLVNQVIVNAFNLLRANVLDPALNPLLDYLQNNFVHGRQQQQQQLIGGNVIQQRLPPRFPPDVWNVPIFCSGLKGRRPFWLLNPPSRGGS